MSACHWQKNRWSQEINNPSETINIFFSWFSLNLRMFTWTNRFCFRKFCSKCLAYILKLCLHSEVSDSLINHTTPVTHPSRVRFEFIVLFIIVGFLCTLVAWFRFFFQIIWCVGPWQTDLSRSDRGNRLKLSAHNIFLKFLDFEALRESRELWVASIRSVFQATFFLSHLHSWWRFRKKSSAWRSFATSRASRLYLF